MAPSCSMLITTQGGKRFFSSKRPRGSYFSIDLKVYFKFQDLNFWVAGLSFIWKESLICYLSCEITKNHNFYTCAAFFAQFIKLINLLSLNENTDYRFKLILSQNYMKLIINHNPTQKDNNCHYYKQFLQTNAFILYSWTLISVLWSYFFKFQE